MLKLAVLALVVYVACAGDVSDEFEKIGPLIKAISAQLESSGTTCGEATISEEALADLAKELHGYQACYDKAAADGEMEEFATCAEELQQLRGPEEEEVEAYKECVQEAAIKDLAGEE